MMDHTSNMASDAKIQLHFRPANIEDAVRISQIGWYATTIMIQHTVTTEQLEAFLEADFSVQSILKDMSNPLKDYFVGTNAQDEIIGFVLLTQGTTEPCLEPFANAVELQRIYVEEKQHGKGVGRALAEKAENVARKMGFKHVWLGVWEENAKAKRFYKGLGYEFVGDHPFNVSGEVQTDLIMVKKL